MHFIYEFENVLNLEHQNFYLCLKVNKFSCQKLTECYRKQYAVTINDQPIKKVNETETLGMTIDEHLAWSKHVEEESTNISSAIGALNRVRPFIIY